MKWFNQEYKIVNENGNEHIAKICDLYNHFKEGEFYMNLSKKQKRDEYSKKGFIEKVKENVKLKAYFHEDKIIGGIHYRNILTHCCKMDIEENENEDIY